MFKLDLEKTEEPEIQLPTSTGSLQKQESSRQASTSALLTMLKPLTLWITANWKSLQEMGIPDLRNLYSGQEATARTRHGSTDWFQIRKGVRQGCILSADLTYMQSTSCKMLGWMKHKLESRLPGEISLTQICR